MKSNHNSLAYKMRTQPNKTDKDLRQKQKGKISDWIFQAVCKYYREHGKMPEGEDASKIAVRVYEKVKSTAIWVPYEEFYKVFLYKLPRYEARIAEQGLPEPKPQKPPKSEHPPKKRDNSNKICPECGRKMHQQFIGLQHCNCGMSWLRGEGFFERTSDMVFALERRKIGTKYKQCPVIRFKE